MKITGEYAYFLYGVTSSSLHNGYLKYFKFKAGTQPAIPFTVDLYVSDVNEAFVDSNITTTVKYGGIGYRGTEVKTQTLDSVVTATSTFLDGMYHVTSVWQETDYSISFQWTKSGTTYTAAASGTAAGEGILRVTDATPYVVRGNVDPFGSKGTTIQTDSDIYVMLEGTGTVIISASEVYESDEVDVYGLPSNVPWVLETEYGETVYAGITQNDRITIPVPENPGVGAHEFSLAVYEDGFSDRVRSGDMLLDLVNEEVVRIDFDDPTRDLIYIPSNYMRYPMTASVDIGDVRLAKIRDDCSQIELQRLNFLSKEYSSGSTMNVPFIPGMSALKMTIDDTDTCIKFEDVVPQVQLSVMRGESLSATNSSLVDLTVNSRSSIILASNDPVSVSISFGASGFSEQSRRTYPHDAHMSNPVTGNTFTCTNPTRWGGGANVQPPHCPEPAKSILGAAANIGLTYTMENYFTKYEITVDLLKNGEMYDSVTLPINSLNAVPPLDLVEKFNLGLCTIGRDNNNLLVEPLQANSTTVTGGHGTQFYDCVSHPASISYHSIAGTSWSETFTRTFDIQGAVGDQFDILVSNNIIFSFPVPAGHHNYYAGELIYDWPPVFETAIANGTPFLGGAYTQMIVPANSFYGPDDRGVFVGLNDGFVIVTPKS